MKNKKIIILISIVILVIGILIGLLIIKRNSEDNKIKEKLTPIVENFYENTYYLTMNKELLKDFTNIGINISLEELIEYEEENINDYKKYNTSKSNLTIYPKEPYEKKDYIIEIKLYRN